MKKHLLILLLSLLAAALLASCVAPAAPAATSAPDEGTGLPAPGDSLPDSSAPAESETEPVTDKTAAVLQSAERMIRYPVYDAGTGTLQSTREVPLRISVVEYPKTGERGITVVLPDSEAGDTEIYSFRGYGCVFLRDADAGSNANPQKVTHITVLIFDPRNNGSRDTDALNLTYDTVTFSNMNYSNKSTFRATFLRFAELDAFISRITGSLRDGMPGMEVAAFLRADEFKINAPGAQPLTQADLDGLQEYIRTFTADADSWEKYFGQFPPNTGGNTPSGGKTTETTELQSFHRTIYVEQYDPATQTSRSVPMPLRISATHSVTYRNGVAVTEDITGKRLCPEDGYTLFLEKENGEQKLLFLSAYEQEKPGNSLFPEPFLHKYGFICLKEDEVNGVRVTKFLSYQFTPDYKSSQYSSLSRVARITTEIREFYITDNAPGSSYRSGRFLFYEPSHADKNTYELDGYRNDRLYRRITDSYAGGEYLLQYGLDGAVFYDEGRSPLDDAAIALLYGDLIDRFRDYFPGFTMSGGILGLPRDEITS